MRSFKKRMLSALLTIAMVTNQLPIGAFATEAGTSDDYPNAAVVATPEEEGLGAEAVAGGEASLEGIASEEGDEAPDSEAQATETVVEESDGSDEGEELAESDDAALTVEAYEGDESQDDDESLGTEADPATIHQHMVEQADAWYGEGGTYNPKVSVTISPSTSNELVAGSVLTYTVGYTFEHAENWEEGYDGQTAFYDYYGTTEHPNTATIKLPAGLLLTGSGLGANFTSDPDDMDPNVEHTYTLPFPEQIEAAAMHSTFTITIYVCNNGTENSINTYTFPEDMVTLSTTFEVLDKQDPDNYETVGTYTHTVKAKPDDITTESPDQWGVKKNGVADLTKYDATAKTVTFAWDVEVGLLEDNEVKILNADYSRVGRNLLEELKLTDTFTTTIDAEGVTVGDPKTVTIAKYDDQGVLGATQTLTGGSAMEVWDADNVDDTKPLQLNHKKLIDSNGDSTLDQDTPIYTKYRVVATYDVADEWIAHFPLLKGYTLKQNNKAETEAKLAKIADPQKNSDDDDQEVPLPFDGAAKLTLDKVFTDYKGNESAYTTALQNLYGPLTYTISAGTVFTVYEKSGDTIKPIEGMTGATSYNLVTGKDYYLVPGIEYTVKETLTDAQKNVMKQTDDPATFVKTPKADEAWKVTFHNKETVGKITVTKTDDAGRKLSGVGFTLYDSTGATVVTAEKTTGSNGTISFDRLPYGTYTLKETTPPADGYVAAADQQVTISADNANVTVTAVNKVSKSKLILTKYVGLAEETITNKATDKFPGTFTLERTTKDPATASDSDWVTVGEAEGVNSLGQIVKTLDAFDSTGKVYWYRFKENIPTGYYDPATGSTTVSYSTPVTLTEEKDGVAYARPLSDPVEVSMYNRKFVRANISKLFFIVNKDGKLEQSNDFTTTVKLYSYAKSDYTDLTEVRGATPDSIIGNNSSGVDYADWLNLPLYGPDGRIHYLVQEGDVTYGATTNYGTFIVDETQTGNAVTINGVRYFDISTMTTAFTNAMYSESTLRPMSKALYNVQNLYPVQIWKKNYYTEAGVDGAGVTVYDKNGDVAYGYVIEGGAKVKKLLKDIPVKTDTSYYVTIYLEPGQEYTFKETVNNTGLKFHSLSNEGKITLPTTAQTYANRNTAKNTTRTIYNAPDPLVRIKKVDSTNASKTLTAEFAVYKLNAEGKYEPVLDESNQPIVINSSSTDQAYRLEPGDYYFAETTVPDGYLDPNDYFDEYESLGDYVQGETKDGQTLTFVKGVVKDMTKSGTSDNICTFTFKNIPNLGQLKVLKWVDGKPTNIQPGFKITVVGDDGSSTSLVTDKNGQVTFSLPVYGTDGKKITYTVSEELTDAQALSYTKVSDDQTTTLTLGEVTSKDTSGNDLIVKNETKISYTADKVFRKSWEYGFTGYSEPQAGATIGLFVKAEDGQNWTLVDATTLSQTANPQVTDENGQVKFSGLTRGVDYVLVELDSGDSSKFPYDPTTGTFLELPADGVNTTTIANAALAKYNVIRISGDDTKLKENATNTTAFPTSEVDPMVNSNHWIQFDMTKWLDHVANRVLEPNQFGRGTVNNPYADGSEFTEVDNVVFEVYRYIMPDGETEAAYPGDGWTSLGTYTTGTLYINNVRQSGEFITVPDQGINDNYVYLIVEKNVGPNSVKVNPNYKYTFWSADGKGYSVRITDAEYSAIVARTKTYEMDAVNYDDIVNVKPEGPGSGITYLASLRLTKWKDQIDDQGNLTNDYLPLPGATFEITLADGTLLDTVTVGLDDKVSTIANPLAIAQSCTFQLVINDDGTYTLKDFETDKEFPNVDATSFTFKYDGATYTGYRVPVKIKETVCPDAYEPAVDVLDTYLCFVDITNTHQGQSWVFNDAYYVTTSGKNTKETLASDQSATSWYITNASSGNNINVVAVGDTDNPSPLRIVNYPTTNAMVHLTKYGYKPTTDTLNKTAAQLDELATDAISRVALPGVTMTILKKDGNTFKPWNYRKNEFGTAAQAQFQTKTDGSFLFPDGLSEGVYQIYEENLGSNAGYEMTYPKARPRQFVVGTAFVDMSLYNPTKLSLTLVKQGMDGSALADLEFKLNSSSGSQPSTTDSDGKVSFTDIASGKYWITETKAGYSSAYLEKYLKSEYSLTGFTKSPGVEIGYAYTTASDGSDGTDYVISKVNPGTALLDGPASLKLTIKNPKTATVTLKKVDYSGENPVAGAKFIGYYRAFDNYTGTTDLSSKSLTTRAELEAAGFALNNSLAGTTDSYGILSSLTNKQLDPGIYAFIETEAPAGYDVRKTKTGGEIIYFAIVKSDLTVTVTGIPASVETFDDTALTTKFEGTSSVEFSVKNYQKVTLKAKKTVDSGKLALTDSDKWSITLNLYSDKTKTTKVGTVTIKNDTTQGDEGITFKDPSDSTKDAKFSLGTTYYLEEVVSTPTSNFVLDEVLKDRVAVTLDSDSGMYLFPIESIDGFTITAKNDWLFGSIVFEKKDKGTLAPLSGAQFKVEYQKEDGTWAEVANAVVTEETTDGAGTGKYTALVPLVSAEATKYRLVETVAPTDYLLPEGPVLEVEMSLQDNVKSEELKLTVPNTKGNHLTIYKNANVYGASNAPLAEDNQAEFAIYRKLADNTWTLVTKEFIKDGKVTLLTVPGGTYAVAESYFDSDVFNALDGMYQGDTKLTAENITVGEETVEAYVISTASDVELHAYNVPNMKPIIRKIDVGQYQAGATYPKDNVKAKMNYAIYEVEEGALPAEPTRAEVEEFLASHTSIFTGATDTYDAATCPNGTTDVWEADDAANRWYPDKTYLLVETSIGAKDGGAYDTLRKDDPAVEWYKVIAPVENPDVDNPPVWELKNVYGDANVTLAKAVVEKAEGDTDNDVVDGSVESLLEGDRKAVFTLTPTVTSQNQMLESFVLKDTSVKAFAGTTEFTGFEYTFDKIVVGGASHTINADFKVADNAPISATVTFKDASGNKVGTAAEITNVNDSSANTITAIPDGCTSFEISYSCAALVTATTSKCDKPYALGEQFKVDPTTVYITAKQQADGTADSPVDEITKFTNYAHVDLGYWKWSNAGVLPDTPTYKSADANDSVNVKSVVIPKVAILKSVPSTTASLNQTVEYTIKVTNLNDSPTVFENPIVLDILPTAVNYVAGSAPESVTGTGGETLSVTTEIIEGAATHTSQNGTEVSEREKAIMFKLTGVLGVGSSFEIKYHAKIAETAGLFASVLQNDAYLSSPERSFHTKKNPQGCPFVNHANEYGKSLDNAATALGGTATTREGGMKDALDAKGNYATGDYRWLASEVHQNINERTTVTIRKAVWGDRDTQGFHDTGLGVASRTNGATEPTSMGWVKWRLSIKNGYTDREYIDHLRIGDVLPSVGDGSQRNSKWLLNMYDNSILTIMNDGTEVSSEKYTVYYYTGSTADAEDALLLALNDGNLTGWKSSSEITNYWSIDGEFDTSAYKQRNEVTAFVVVFDEDVKIQRNTSMILVYDTKVVDEQDDEKFFDNYAFMNDSNYFWFKYQDPTLDGSLRSNTVNVTLLDRPVEIQGDLWIDEDQDGTQGSANRRDYSGYAIVQALANSMSFSITDKRAASGATKENDTGTMDQHSGGESIKHFRFDGLGAATTKAGRDPYKDDSLRGKILNIVALKGDDPYNYVLNATLTDNTAEGNLQEIFKLSALGTGHYMSDNPDATDFTSSANFLDNNFFEGNSATEFQTYPFYVMYSNNVDQSKDIGFMMYRKLELEKVATDDENTKIEGAKFEVYGPYDDSTLGTTHTAASGSALKFSGSDGVYELDPNGTVTQLVTDANGKISISGLNWWKEYDIKEVEAGAGYQVAGATVTAAAADTQINDLGDGVFTLMVPSQDKVTATDKVQVKNPRYAEINLQAEKMLKSYSEEEFSFDYELRLTSVTPETTSGLNQALIAKDPIETITIKVAGNAETETGSNVGKFTTLKVCGAGTYVFRIKEIAPDPLPAGWTYDPQLEKTATVTVEWSETEQKLVVSSISYSEPHTRDDSKTYLLFTNKYAAEGEWTPEVSKKLTGRPIVAGEFTFTVTEGETVVSTGSVNADGSITFTPIKYASLKEVGTHTYTITEDSGTLPGVTYASPITATVKIEDTGGKLEATSVEYSPNAEFVNTFDAEGTWAPEIFKIFTGRDMREDERYEVTVTDQDGNTVMTGTAEAGVNGEPKAFTLTPEKITYTDEDVVNFEPTTYTYTITETVGSESGVTYDSTTYDVNVTVALKLNEDGTYSDELDVTDDAPEDGFVFTNPYVPTPAVATAHAEKTTSGDPIPEGLSFLFEFTMTAEEVVDGGCALTADPDTAIAAGDSWTQSVTIDAYNTTASVDFDEIQYTKPGTYVYKIVENQFDSDLVICDSTEWTYTVTVTDDLHGTLSATEAYAAGSKTGESATFDNVVTTESVGYVPKVKKTLIGNPLPEDMTFDFMLEASADNPEGASLTSSDKPLTASVTVPVGKTGEGIETAFHAITFERAGTYVFTVKEVKGDLADVTYDETVYTLTVVVTSVNGYYTIESATYEAAGKTASDSAAEFVNDYTGGLVEISGTKTWNDNNNRNKLRTQSIIIRLYADGEEIKMVTVTRETGWQYSFGMLPKYKDGKEIVYTISEDVVRGYTTTYNGYDVINTLNHTPPTHDDVALRYWMYALCASAVVMLAAAFGLRRRERKS